MFPGNSISNDVASDVYLKLYAYPPNKLLDMVYNGKIQAFIYITIRNHIEDLRRLRKRRLSAEYNSIDLIDEPDYTEAITNKLNKLTDEELKFISIYVSVGTQSEMVSKYKLSGRYINEMKKQINLKIK